MRQNRLFQRDYGLSPRQCAGRFPKNKKTPVQAIEQNKQVAQSKVDAVFNKK
jgi:hypothetical protein